MDLRTAFSSPPSLICSIHCRIKECLITVKYEVYYKKFKKEILWSSIQKIKYQVAIGIFKFW